MHLSYNLNSTHPFFTFRSLAGEPQEGAKFPRAQFGPVTDAVKLSTQRFMLPAKKVYQNQYKDIYMCRLHALRPQLLKTVGRIMMSEEGAPVPIHQRIIDAHPGVECVVVGTLYKDMPLKPCILDEYDDNPDAASLSAAVRGNFCGPDDAVVLEDDNGRIQLALTAHTPVYSGATAAAGAARADTAASVFPSSVSVETLVSGLLVAVHGTETETGEFAVKRIFFPDVTPPVAGAALSAHATTTSVVTVAPRLSGPVRAAAAAAPAAMTDADAGADACTGESTAAATAAAPSQLATAAALPTDTYVAFISHLSLTGDTSSTTVAAPSPVSATVPASTPAPVRSSPARAALLRDIACDYLLGLAGGPADAACVSRVAHVVVAGDTFEAKPPPLPAHELYRSATAAAQALEAERARVADSIAAVDAFATRLAASVPVTFVAGANDPTNATLPQQPLHPCLFASAATFTTFATATNPALLAIGAPSIGSTGSVDSTGVPFMMLGTGGQNVSDMLRFSTLSPLGALALSYRARVVAPTAPDTLGCYPYATGDPFVIDAAPAPRVYFAGAQPYASAAIVRNPTASADDDSRTLLLTVPRFSETAELLLVNTRTLAVTVVGFGALEDELDS
jgi:DNA polymerase delta subunit 2